MIEKTIERLIVLVIKMTFWIIMIQAIINIIGGLI